MKRIIASTLVCFLLSTAAAFAGGWPGSNDNLFRPPAAARKHIDFTPRGFLIDGHPTFVDAAEVQYPRIPRALWRDRLLRVKRAGYNAIQTYAYWSYHEPKEGQWDFKTGNHDFRAFLDLVHSMGMYAVVRVGPYVNAEWDSGGYPVWLRFKKGVVVRVPNAPFEAAVDEWFDKIIPLVASEQVTRGGPVILVQLENEHRDGAGTDLPNDYFRHLQSKALSLGIDVPYFFSGLNHSSDPMGDSPIDPNTRQSPWYSSEFWTGWIATYGVDPARAHNLTRATWKVIAMGGTGFSHYTVVGGTDFDHWACDEQASAYDFGAPIGQQGDFRIDYYPIRRANLFADAFTDILATSDNASNDYARSTVGDPVSVYARKSPTGTIVFFDDKGGSPAKVQFRDVDGALAPKAGPITVDPGEIVPFVKDRPLPGGITLRLAAVRLLGVVRDGKTLTLVGYGHPGESAEMHFDLPSGRKWAVAESIPSTGVRELSTPAGALRLRVLLMSTDMADRTWFVDDVHGQEIVTGPDYVGETSPSLYAEYNPGTANIPDTIAVYGNGPAKSYRRLPDSTLPGAERAGSGERQGARGPTGYPLSPWQFGAGPAEASTTFDDLGWYSSQTPRPMGADGDTSAYAWYRADVTSPGGRFGLNFADAGDWLAIYVNGKFAGETSVVTRYDKPAPRGVPVTLATGVNHIAVLAAHYGRNKLFPWYGPLDDIDSKGIRGDVGLAAQPTSTTSITTWRWKMDDRGPASAGEMSTADATGAGWRNASIGQDVFQGHIGYAWFRTTLPAGDSGARHTIHFVAVDDNAFVYLNGKQLATNYGYNVPFDVDLDPAWNDHGPNELAVLDQNTAQGGGISESVTLTASYPSTATITGWRMRGNITTPSTWKLFGGVSMPPPGPVWYRSTFTLPSGWGSRRRTALRVSTVGLSRGFVWFNGHNLGRYPEKSPVDGIYLPECWQKVGKNEVTIFDEDGNRPQSVKIYEETAASRGVGIYRPISSDK